MKTASIRRSSERIVCAVDTGHAIDAIDHHVSERPRHVARQLDKWTFNAAVDGQLSISFVLCPPGATEGFAADSVYVRLMAHPKWLEGILSTDGGGDGGRGGPGGPSGSGDRTGA